MHLENLFGPSYFEVALVCTFILRIVTIKIITIFKVFVFSIVKINIGLIKTFPILLTFFTNSMNLKRTSNYDDIS